MAPRLSQLGCGGRALSYAQGSPLCDWAAVYSFCCSRGRRPHLCFGRPVAPTPPVTSPSPSSSLPVRLRLSTGEVIWGECPHLPKCQSHPFHLFTKYGLRPFAVYQGQSSCWGPKCGAPCPSTQRGGTCSHVPSTQEVLRGFGLSRWDRSSDPNSGVPHKQREVNGECCSTLEEGAMARLRGEARERPTLVQGTPEGLPGVCRTASDPAEFPPSFCPEARKAQEAEAAGRAHVILLE